MRTLHLVAIGLCAAIVGTTASGSEAIDEQAAMQPDGTLEVANTAGSVEIRGWDKDEVRVSGRLADGAELEFSAEGSRTRIKVEPPRRNHRDGDTRLVIRTPGASRLRVTTVSADIAVEDVRGAKRLHSVSGDVELDVWGEEVEVKTVSGDIDVVGHGEAGSLTLTLVSGDAEVRDVAGEISLQTVSGEMDIHGGAISRARLNSTSGDVDLRGELTDDGRIDAQSISGDILLALCGPVDAEFALSSFSGDIEGFFGQKPTRTSKYAPGVELRFEQGSGSGRVEINTMSGDIEFEDC